MRQEESKYYINEKKNGIQKMWKNLARLLNPDKRGTKHKTVDKLVINGQTIYKDKEIANAFNNFFSNIGNELSKEVPDTNHQKSFKDYLPDPIKQSIYLKPITKSEIEQELEKLNARKSILDIFNINIIKMVKHQIIPGLVIIFNNSINEGTFPEMLKIAKVIPVHKKNDEFVTGNYRPISLLSVFYKLLENSCTGIRD